MKTRKLLLNALPLLLIGTAMVYAAAPSGGYLPGATTDPACAPGDTDCVVQVPADTDDQTLSLTGTNLSIQDGNTVDLSGLSGTNIWSQSGATTYYNNGNVGIGTNNPQHLLSLSGSTVDGRTISINNTPVIYLQDANSIAIGDGLRSSTGDFNTSVGTYSLNSNTTGGYNTANGYESLNSNTTGGYNTANGYRSLMSTSTGSHNTANGSYSLRYNTTGRYNTANGYQSLYSNTTGQYNTANGYESLRHSTTGGYNTANGSYSLRYNTTGGYNTANGYQSLRYNTTGGSNAAYGHSSLSYNTTGTDNTAIGNNAGSSITTGNYNIAIGSDAQVASPTADNQLSIGNWIYGINGDIGIGTDSPTEKLDVRGNIVARDNSTTPSHVLSIEPNSGPGGGNYLRSFGDGTSNYDVFNFRGDGFSFYSPGGYAQETITFTNTGSLGVGTDSPTEKLEVNGTAKVQKLSAGYERLSQTFSNVGPNEQKTLSCPTGKLSVGGGCAAAGSALTYNLPASGGSGWTCGKETGATTGQLAVYVLCLSVE